MTNVNPGEELPEHVDVLVIGGGVGGLTAAYEFTRCGLKPLVIDAFRWTGGVVGRHFVAGMSLDAGAESYAVAVSSVTDLINDLGGSDLIEEPNPVGAWVRFEDGTAPLPVGGSLGIPADPFAEDVQVVLGAEGAQEVAKDLDLPPDVGINPNGVTTLGALVRARMGDLVVERLVEPVVGGVHSADPDLLDIDVISPRMRGALAKAGTLSGAVRELRGNAGRAGSAVAGLHGGLHVLIDLLTDAITQAGGSVVCSVKATDIVQNGSQWVTTVESDGESKQITSNGVVIGVPGADAAPLLTHIDPQAAQLLQNSPSCRIMLVTLVLDDARLDAAPRGTGILVSSKNTDVRAKAMTHASVKWSWVAEAAGPGRHVIRLSYGRDGEGIPSKEEAVECAMADASTMLGLELDPSSLVESAIIMWNQGMPRADDQHAKRVAAARSAMDAHPGIDMVGAFTAGTGLAAIVADARARAREIAANCEGASL